MNTYYLIDYENVHEDGLSGCQTLGKADAIVIFFTENGKKIDMDSIADHGEAALDMIKVPAGKQSADMHIGSYLGYLAGLNGKNCGVVIISKDTDYDNVIRFWSDKTGITASRSEQIVETPASEKTTTKKAAASSPKTTTKKAAASTSKTTTKKAAASTSKTTTKKAAASSPKTSTRSSSAGKTKLKREVQQAVGETFEGAVADTVARIAVDFYGNEQMLSEVHNALQERYANYLEVYEAAKPVLSRYADEHTKKGKETTKKE